MNVGTPYLASRRHSVSVWPCTPSVPETTKNRVIKHTQHTFGFGCEVHVPRRIQQGQAQVAVFRQCLVRENRDASRLLQGIGVQKRIAVIHSPQFADLTGTVEQSLGQRGLARVTCATMPATICFISCAPFPMRRAIAGRLTNISEKIREGKLYRQTGLPVQ